MWGCKSYRNGCRAAGGLKAAATAKGGLQGLWSGKNERSIEERDDSYCCRKYFVIKGRGFLTGFKGIAFSDSERNCDSMLHFIFHWRRIWGRQSKNSEVGGPGTIRPSFLAEAVLLILSGYRIYLYIYLYIHVYNADDTYIYMCMYVYVYVHVNVA